MAHPNPDAAEVQVQFYDDRSKVRTTEIVTPALAGLFSYSEQWARKSNRIDPCTLTFSSMLAAMVAGESPWCGWLQRHLGLRGVRAATITNDWAIRSDPFSAPLMLTTSISFRTAWAQALKLRRDPSLPVDVRHVMAAYAVCPQYHLLDFLRLRIDRRAWCLELADRLRETYPAEDLLWRAYATLAAQIPLPEFNTDAPEGRDLLNIDREVEAFSQLIAARTTHTPLSVGVFGAWGSGKSFFMRRVRDHVARLCEDGKDIPGSQFHSRIAQIEFNAWHYSEGSLIASLVDHIFHNLRIGVADEDEATLRQRSAELIIHLEHAKHNLAEHEHGVAAAEKQRLKAEDDLAAIKAGMPAQIFNQRQVLAHAQTSMTATESELAEAEARKLADMELAAARAPIVAATDVLITGLANPDVAATQHAVREMIGETKRLTSRWVPLAFGLVMIGIGLLATGIVQSELYGRIISLIAAVGTAATAATVVIRKLNTIAGKGAEFQAAHARIENAARLTVIGRHRFAIDHLTEKLQVQRDIERAANDKLTELVDAAGLAKNELERLDREHAVALERYAQASADVLNKQATLHALGHQSLLGEFLDDQAVTGGYRMNLTIFTQVRNDFERLSKLMTRATDEHAKDNAKPPPTVSRIVLYIDDLDRCPEEKVIEVLRTVHLLLAFPLFVCVVAVDPRWVSRCLQNAPGVLGTERLSHDIHAQTAPADWIGHRRAWRGPAKNRSDQTFTTQITVADQLDETFGGPATPADYLEKIFQIPLWLRPVPSAQRTEIVRALLNPQPERRDQHVMSVITARTSLERDSYAPAREEQDRIALIADTIRPDLGIVDTRINRSAAAGATNRAPMDPTIDSVELDYLGELGGLLDGNPRALKRFVNTYRLVKASLSDIELDVFRSEILMLGDSTGRARYLPYRICMAQLAVLCTQRQRALRTVRLADAKPPSLGGWLDQIAAEDAELADMFRGMLPSGFPDPKKVPFDTFALWLERTRRYSFYL